MPAKRILRGCIAALPAFNSVKCAGWSQEDRHCSQGAGTGSGEYSQGPCAEQELQVALDPGGGSCREASHLAAPAPVRGQARRLHRSCGVR